MPLWFRLLLGLVQNGTYQWITQSFRLKKTSRSSSPIFDSSPLCQPDHVTKCHIYSFLEHFQVWYIHYCPGQSVPMFNNPLQEENLMSILNLPWCSLRLLSFCPIAGCMGEKDNPTWLQSPLKKLKRVTRSPLAWRKGGSFLSCSPYNLQIHIWYHIV